MNETHEPQFRGIWYPAEILALLRDKAINPTEFALLGVIESLVRLDGGCHASNTYLGEQVGKGAQVVSDAIAKFKKMGLLFATTGEKGRRELETPWSRGVRGPRPKDLGPLGQKTYGRSLLRNDLDTKQCEGSRSAPPHGFGVKEELSVERKLSIKLQTHVMRHRKLQSVPQPKTWDRNFSKLIQEVGSAERVELVLDWYITHHQLNFMPEVYSAETFHKKFIQIEGRMVREAHPKEVEPSVELDAIGLQIFENEKKNYPRLEEGLKKCIAESCRGFDTWKALHSKLEIDPGSGLAGFVDDLLGPRFELNSKRRFLTRWFDDVGRAVAGWTDWGGSFKTFTFSFDAERFRRKVTAFSSEYSSRVPYASRYFQLLDHHANRKDPSE